MSVAAPSLIAAPGARLPGRRKLSCARARLWIACSTGKYVGSTGSVAASDCIDGVAGKYADGLNNTVCDSCASGKYSATVASQGETDCISCPTGKWLNTTSNDDLTDCTDCGTGMYHVSTGQIRRTDIMYRLFQWPIPRRNWGNCLHCLRTWQVHQCFHC